MLQNRTRRNKKQQASSGKAKAVFYFLFYLVLVLFIYSFTIPFSNPMSLYLSSATFSLLFPTSVFAYLLFKGHSLGDIVDQLGLSKKHFSSRMLAIGLMLFLIVFLIEILVSLISSAMHISINTGVSTLLSSAPLWFGIFAVVVAPLDEEILFRGFMVPRIGIWLSAFIFAILHYGYNSTYGIEVIAAFIFAAIAGYIFKRTKSLYPSLLAHMLVNLLPVLLYMV